jgi:hypothetical protein
MYPYFLHTKDRYRRYLETLLMHPKRIGIRGLKFSHSNKNGNSTLACEEEKKKEEKMFCRPDRPLPNGYKIRTRNDR